MNNIFIEELLCYARSHLLLKDEDVVFYRNFLMHEFEIENEYDGQIDVYRIHDMDVPDYFTNEMVKFYQSKGLNEKQIDEKIAYIFGTLMPRPSTVRKHFYKAIENENPKEATDTFYRLCVASNYVQKTKIDRNINLKGHVGNNDIIAAINLSKPEKSNKDIAKLAANKGEGSDYPKCAICVENEGCYGSKKTPARNNLRVIPMELDGRPWYMQYSPYGYFNEHCIVFSHDHTPMKVNKSNLRALFDFVDLIPHYFIGSNSDLPIVGGSILNHEHFQGGCFEMPIMHASPKEEIPCDKFPEVRGSLLDYPGTVFRFVSEDKEQLLDLLETMLNAWQKYDNEKLKIVAKNHNTMTTIVRKISDHYIVYVVLRNNRCDDENPDGIFHTRKSLHMLKKEGIGLIEIAGNCVLPPRLKRQLDTLQQMVVHPEIRKATCEKSPDMVDFLPMLEVLDKEGEKYDIAGKLYDGCYQMLKDIDVFKFDDEKHTQLFDFIKCLN